MHKKWSKSEDEDLIDSYVDKEFDLRDIAELHDRTQLAIAARLVKLNAAPDIKSVKGFKGNVPLFLCNLKATKPIIRKKESENRVNLPDLPITLPEVDNTLKIDTSHISTPELAIVNPNNDQVGVIHRIAITEHHLCHNCNELSKRVEELEKQLIEAMTTIEELTRLL